MDYKLLAWFWLFFQELLCLIAAERNDTIDYAVGSFRVVRFQSCKIITTTMSVQGNVIYYCEISFGL